MPQTTLDPKVTIAGNDISSKHEVHDLVVESDLDQPDMAAITLSNESTKYSETVVEGDDVLVEMGFSTGKAPGTVFKGEVTGIEPEWGQKESRVVIRAFNKLHVLARGKNSVAYLNVKDTDIADKICQKYSLTGQYGNNPPSTKYDHV
jgi:hypothetical protein